MPMIIEVVTDIAAEPGVVFDLEHRFDRASEMRAGEARAGEARGLNPPE